MELCFKHGSGWHENQKLVNLIIETGYEGYGVFNVVLELLLSHGGSLELNYKKLNYIVRCRTELLKQVINQFDLFTVVTENDGRVMFYAEWLLEDIKKAQKTSEARSANGRKGLRSRYGGKKTSELAEPEADNLANASQDVAIATAKATTNAIANAHTHARIVVDNITDSRSSSRSNARENFSESSKTEDESSQRKPLTEHIPILKNDSEWRNSLAVALKSNGAMLNETQIADLFDGFCQEKFARGEHKSLKTLAEAKAWFFNWLMFKIEKLKRDGNNKPSVAKCSGGNAVAAPTGYSGGYRKSFAEQVRESKEKLLRDTARMLQNGELGSLGIGRELPRDLQP